MNKVTNKNNSASQRGREAACYHLNGHKVDFNEVTGEENPYPLQSRDFEIYEDAKSSEIDNLYFLNPHLIDI